MVVVLTEKQLTEIKIALDDRLDFYDDRMRIAEYENMPEQYSHYNERYFYCKQLLDYLNGL